jgi:putative membrane protein
MKPIGSFTLVATAALALAACGRTYQSPAQRAEGLGQPAVGLSSDPVLYDSTGAVASEPRRYPADAYPAYAAGAVYYPAYPPYPAGTACYYPCAAGATYAMAVAEQDRQFLLEALDDGAAEIELARYAYDRASASAVRGYSRQLLDDRSRLANQLAALAMRRGVGPIPAPSGTIPGDLAYRDGRDFDLAYLDYAMRAQDRAIGLFEREAAASGGDPEVRSAAASAMSTLETHRAMADRIRDELD